MILTIVETKPHAREEKKVTVAQNSKKAVIIGKKEI
jgi:hypothetical protein